MNRVDNKIALVTGSAKGIGKEVSRLLADEGAFVIVTDILDDQGQKLVQEIDKNACYYHLNVANEKEWQNITDIIHKRFSHIDILVNNAGVTGLSHESTPHDPENVSLEDWQYVHQVNLDGVFLGCKYGIKLMKHKGGSIINMSSRSGIVGIPTTAAYASSKAAIRNHTKTVALYCAGKNYNIRCNSIHPGAILTDIWNPMFGEDKISKTTNQQNLAKSIPLKKMGKPIDVAYTVLYLASDESQYMTGAELVLDGGILAGSQASPIKKD